MQAVIYSHPPKLRRHAEWVVLPMQIATHQVWEYLGEQDTWVAKAPMTTSRFRFNAAFNGEAVWAFGGQSSAICTAAGDGLQDCTKRPLNTSEAFYDASADDVFIYVQSE